MEPTLSLQLTDYQKEIRLFLGWSDAERPDIVTSLLKSGYDQFLHPPTLEGQMSSYEWSFMKPTANLSLASGSSVIPMPDDFGGPEGRITIQAQGSNAQPWMIEWRNSEEVRRMYAGSPTASGPPRYASLQAMKGTSASHGQQSQLYIYPASDRDYTVQMQYYLNPDALSTAFPYAYGGSQHSELLKASCLAAAELYLDDTRGPRWQYFMERLAASISVDKRNKAQSLGRNRDRSDEMHRYYGNQHQYVGASTYNGASWD